MLALLRDEGAHRQFLHIDVGADVDRQRDATGRMHRIVPLEV